MFDDFPKVRPHLPKEFRDIYAAHYRANREGRTRASSLAQKAESWLHKQVARDVSNPKNSDKVTLELGAGTLNQLRYESLVESYDIASTAESEEADFRRQHAADALARLYLHEQRNEQALDVAERTALSVDVLAEIADASQDQPDRLPPIYTRIIDFHMAYPNNDAYRKAIAVLKQVEKALGGTHQELLLELVGGMVAKYRPKRNFVKWTLEVFPDAVSIN